MRPLVFFVPSGGKLLFIFFKPVYSQHPLLSASFVFDQNPSQNLLPNLQICVSLADWLHSSTVPNHLEPIDLSDAGHDTRDQIWLISDPHQGSENLHHFRLFLQQ